MKTYQKILFITVMMLGISCHKFLDKKPSANLATISKLDELQLLLDYYDGMNGSYPTGPEVFADNYYLTQEDWAALRFEYERNYYIWIKDDNTLGNWSSAYRVIYTTNLVSESVQDLEVSQHQMDKVNNILGSACFFRAFYFYGLAQFYAESFDENSAASTPGIPLRLTTAYTEPIKRNTLKETYEQIIQDFKNALALLPDETSITSRPSRAAAYGALARVYLSMRNYQQAFLYADSCLSFKSDLIDYNSLDPASPYPIDQFNDEVIFQAVTPASGPINFTLCRIDSNLYRSYNNDDLRKTIFFYKGADDTFFFKGDYDGGNNSSGTVFSGIVTDEIYLTHAECAVRLGNLNEARESLNQLLVKRYKTGTFQPVVEENGAVLLNMILLERRKELLFRGTRLTDLKRLNKEPEHATIIKRMANGEIYELKPGDKAYVAQIPRLVIEKDGIEQNP